MGQTANREKPTVDNIKDELYRYNIEPHSVVDKNGVRSVITEHSAISIINRYCSALLSSKYTSLSPIWKLHTIDNDVSCVQQKLFKVLEIFTNSVFQ